MDVSERSRVDAQDNTEKEAYPTYRLCAKPDDSAREGTLSHTPTSIPVSVPLSYTPKYLTEKQLNEC